MFLNTNVLWLELLTQISLLMTAPYLPQVFPTGFLIQISPGSGLAFSFLFSSAGKGFQLYFVLSSRSQHGCG